MLNEFVFEFMIKGRGDNPDDAFNDALEEYMSGPRYRPEPIRVTPIMEEGGQ